MSARCIVTCGGGAAWEAALLRCLQTSSSDLEVARRCVDPAELAGALERFRPVAVVVDAALPWVDDDLVGLVRAGGAVVLAVRARDGLRVPAGTAALATPDPDAILGALRRLMDVTADSQPVPDADPRPPHPEESHRGRVLVVWGGGGAPGRTTLAVHLAVDAASAGVSTVLLDADVWSASVAQTLGLREDPGLARASRLATDGHPTPVDECVQPGPHGLRVLAGLARAELWPEIRDRSFATVLDAARAIADLVVVDLASPIEDDEELAFDRVPYRRNQVTRRALSDADEVLLVTGGDPVALRRGVAAFRALDEALPLAASATRVVVNHAPKEGRRLQDCSVVLEEWIGAPPSLFLPREPALDRVRWEGRPLQELAPRSPWLRELRGLSDAVTRKAA